MLGFALPSLFANAVRTATTVAATANTASTSAAAATRCARRSLSAFGSAANFAAVPNAPATASLSVNPIAAVLSAHLRSSSTFTAAAARSNNNSSSRRRSPARLMATATPDHEVKDGDVVKMHYTGTLDDGSQFDSTREREPLEFTVGAGKVIPGLDDAVRGLTQGAAKKIRLEADEAFGEKRDDRVVEVPAANAPEGLQSGQMVKLNDDSLAMVMEVNDDAVKIDANHPLAGQALTFDVEVVEVQPAAS